MPRDFPGELINRIASRLDETIHQRTANWTITSTQQPDADDGVDLKERLIDSAEIIRPHEAMLIRQESDRARHATEIDPPERRRRHEIEGDKQHGRAKMAEAGDGERSRHAEHRRHASEPEPTIDIHILARIENVEPGDPTEYGEPEHGRREQIVEPANGDPRGEGGQHQRCAEPKVREDRESLGQRIGADKN